MNRIIISELDFSKSRDKMGVKKSNSIHSVFLTQINGKKKKQFFQNWDQWHARFTSKVHWEGCFPLSFPCSNRCRMLHACYSLRTVIYTFH